MALESVHEWFFFALEVGVAEGVEACGMVHFGEMCEFVADNVFAQLQRKENKGATESYGTFCRACAESAQPSAYAPGSRRHPYPCGNLCGMGKKQARSDLPGEATEHGTDELLGGGIGKIKSRTYAEAGMGYPVAYYNMRRAG